MDIQTKYGLLRGCIAVQRHANGALSGCLLKEKSTLQTACGVLTPQYHNDDARRKYINAVSFDADGALRAAALDESTPLQTPLGILSAELVTFYPSGAIKRLFPLNGKISAYWSEQQELARATPLHLCFPFADFCAKIICLHFYASGSVTSVTLAPGETIPIRTTYGAIETRIGFSLYENGALRALEPAKPTPVATPLGCIRAFDPESIGIHADQTSLCFAPDGSIRSLKTIEPLSIQTGGGLKTITPIQKPSPLDERILLTLSLRIEFSDKRAWIERGQKRIECTIPE